VRRTLLAVLAVLSSLALAASARAGDLSGGYSFERSKSGDGASVNRHGWNVSAAFPLTGPVSLVADAGGHYGSSEGVDSRQLTLMAGPRFYYLRGDKYELFAQALGGLLRETASVTVLDVTISESENRLGMLVGAGLDVKAGSRWSVRLSGDYEWSTKDGSSRSGFRAGLGAAWRF
jgi:opacity protein-like surface antigen